VPLIERVSATDKEYHFQNWFKARLAETGLNFESAGRSTYPDFRMVATTEGYELKGLAYPGRTANFDSNSQVPSGFHNGRTVYYVFGRYPKKPDGKTYPVLDLVLCHGNFLNADHEYVHKNKSTKGFGSYGDILIRDRKMYVVPTPFHSKAPIATMTPRKNNLRLIETDAFPFEFVSQLAERESWRKEVHRPIYHVHKWWAKRLGSVFRGILLGTMLPENDDLPKAFYQRHRFAGVTVFDPFMGSGTTIGEAHKLGFTALGRDINPVAVESVRTALGPMDQHQLEHAFHALSHGVGQQIRPLYRSKDAKARPCDVLYYFWVMQVHCLQCRNPVDLFPSWIIARNAYPQRKPEVQILCPSCGDIFPGLHGHETATCRTCGMQFKPEHGPAKGAKATCHHCHHKFTVLDAVAAAGARPTFRLYGKLVLTRGGAKEYLPATSEDHAAYQACSAKLREEIQRGQILLPTLALENGYNTRQAMSYAFTAWRDFFNDRQLLALGLLHKGIAQIADAPTRTALLTLFSGVLEFNNMFASYKGEGTGAVRHMFSHHILKPERTPIEAHVWGTPKSSGSFSNLFRSRLLRAIEYRLAPY